MKISYHLEKKQWYHHEANTAAILTMGMDKQPVPFMSLSEDPQELSFNLKTKGRNAGPIIGILSSLTNNGKLAGNIRLFTDLQVELTKKGGLSIVFTPESITDTGITGYIYSPGRQKWFRVSAPLPHLVYNRVPFRKAEASSNFKAAVRKIKKNSIPFFNPAFINKFELYTILNKDPFFDKMLPETILINVAAQLQDFLERHKRVYLKPVNGAKGIGIYRLSLGQEQNILAESIKDMQHYPNFMDYWEMQGEMLLKRSYIAQPEVSADKINNQRYDFRVLSICGKSGYQVSGIGIRQATKQDLTTHVPAGGKIIPFDGILAEQHERNLSLISQNAGTILSEQLGFYGEFSMDIGLTDTGNYVVYEINSKPMSFDEASIENTRVLHLVDLFLWKSGYETYEADSKG